MITQMEPCQHCDERQKNCGIMEENRESGSLVFPCPYFKPEAVMTAIEDKVMCKTDEKMCLCQPNNCGGKGACGKVIAAMIDADVVQEILRAMQIVEELDKKLRIRPVIIAPPISFVKSLCDGCSYQHYDEEGVGFCGSQEDECPRGGGRF